MNQRTNTIIHMLNDAREPLSLAELAAHFQVSQRTIRNDLNEINSTLRQHQLKTLTLKGGHVLLPDDFDQSIPLLVSGDFYTYKLSREERKLVAAAILVNATGYVTLSEIADHLFVSRATIINDLDSIKAYIQQAGLEVQSHASRGLRVEGPESVKRFFLLELLAPGAQEGRQGGATPRECRLTVEVQQDVVSNLVSVQAGNRVIIQKIINEQEHQHHQFLTDGSFREILFYLGIMVNRNLQGAMLEPQPLVDSDKYYMAQDILRYVTQYCGVTTTEDDIRLLCQMLTRARYMRRESFQNNIVKIQLITRQFIACVSDDLGINLNNDYDFFENLSNHLESVFSAPPATYPESDVIQEVLEDNQDVVDAVQRQLPVLTQYLSRPMTEMEGAYVAVHVCAAIERKKNRELAFRVVVACHAGIGTSRLLLARLKQHFDFQIVDIISAHEATQIKEGTADFVITTVPLQGCPIDYVIVSPLFSDEDYVRVGNKIDALRNSRYLPSRVEVQEVSSKGLIEKIKPVVYETAPKQAPELMKKLRRIIRDYMNQPLEAESEIFSPYLHHLLPASNIELDVECATWQEAVRRSALPLLERGYIEERYIDAMISNIEENGPYVVLSKGFAVPHEGLEQGSVRVGMYLIRLKTPVYFGAEELDPVEFVCCLSAVDHKTHLKAFFNLVNMLREDEFKELLHTAKTPEEAAMVIEKYEYSIY